MARNWRIGAACVQERIFSAGTAFSAVPELLRRVRDSGLRTAVASSAKKDELLSTRHRWYRRYGRCDDIFRRCPAIKACARHFRIVLSKLGVGGDAIAIGDTPYDAEAARKAEIATLGVFCGGFTENLLRQAGCVQVYPGRQRSSAASKIRCSEGSLEAAWIVREGFSCRKFKIYQTSLGFFDLAIAAPSMKAALEASGSRPDNLFHQRAAKESEDPQVIAATLKKPSIVLRRAVGSDGAFSEHAELPDEPRWRATTEERP